MSQCLWSGRSSEKLKVVVLWVVTVIRKTKQWITTNKTKQNKQYRNILVITQKIFRSRNGSKFNLDTLIICGSLILW